MDSFSYAGDADVNKRRYIAEIEEQQYLIGKHFGDMDFENADARTAMEDEVNKMIDECTSLISALKDI